MAKTSSKTVSENQIPALAWLADTAKRVPSGICIVFGEESFLRRTVLAQIPASVVSAQDSDAIEPSVFDASQTAWRNVIEELTTFSMFGPSQRLVILNDADDFVAKNRVELEKWAEAPSETGTLVLEMKTFPSNTRLYRLVDGNGLMIDCRPLNERDELPQWVCEIAQKKHHVTIRQNAATLLIAQIGTEMGLLDQEIAKLALTVEGDEPITEAHIRKNSGSWRMQTVWTLIDCMLDGQAEETLQYLGQLLESGEAPIAIVAQLSSSLRRLATATRIILEEERAGKRPDLNNALVTAGVNRYFVQKSTAQLKRLGRERGQKLLDWLVELDFALKGASTISDRLLLERFILRLTVSRTIR